MVDLNGPDDKNNVEEKAELSSNYQRNAPDEINKTLVVEKVYFCDQGRVCLLVEYEVCCA